MYPKFVYRFSILVVTLIFIVSLNGREASASLPDIPADYSDEIEHLIQNEVINGYPDKTFRPQNQVTREEAVTMVGRALKLNGTQRQSDFTDVKLSDYSSGYVQSALEQKILTMPANKNFRPKDTITRGEMAYLLQRAFDLSEKSMLVYISDVSGNGPLADAVNSVMTAGLSNGYPDGSFKPNNKMTRQEFSLFIARGVKEDFRVDNGFEPIEELAPIKKMVVNATSLNVRSTPNTSDKDNVIGKLPNKAEVTIYRYEGKWTLVSSGNTYGYVHADYLAAPPVKEDPVPEDENVTSPDEEENEDENVTSPDEEENEDENVTSPDEEENEDENGSSPDEEENEDENGSSPDEEENEDENGSSPDEEENEDESGSSPDEEENEDENASSPDQEENEDKITSPSPKGIIAIDAGHGGTDPGAIGNGLQEKEINLAVSLKVQKILEEKGFKVVMIRSNDTFFELEERVDLAVNKKADTFVSIHSNKFSSESANGTETYFSSAAMHPTSAKSKQLATFIQDRLYKALGTQNRGVKDAGFYVIKYNPMPAALVELGFISNKSDAAKLSSDEYREKAAEAIALGIIDFNNTRD